jgi:hypothetical protein
LAATFDLPEQLAQDVGRAVVVVLQGRDLDDGRRLGGVEPRHAGAGQGPQARGEQLAVLVLAQNQDVEDLDRFHGLHAGLGLHQAQAVQDGRVQAVADGGDVLVGLDDLADPGRAVGLLDADVVEQGDPLADLGDGLNVRQVGREDVVQNQHGTLRGWVGRCYLFSGDLRGLVCANIVRDGSSGKGRMNRGHNRRAGALAPRSPKSLSFICFQ